MRPPAVDLDRIMAIMAAAFDPRFGEAWTRSQIEGALLLGNARYRLIAQSGALPGDGEAAAGFALTRCVLDEEELLLFAIVPDSRRRGLGGALLGALIADARRRGIRRMLLEMRAGNAAGSLYHAHGFRAVGRRPNYYRSANGEAFDAITFSRTID
ncbi:MAG: GNAT family N-acetyltransferase [Sphingomonadales bacterium]|nr:GNAT family N-acetyltransferase [Sphingomonadales bacterium]